MLHSPAPFHKILVATDFSDHARVALNQAVSLAKLYGASLTLMHVARDVRAAVEVMTFGAAGGLVTGKLDSIEEDVRSDSDERLQQLVAECRVAGVTADCQTRVGTPFIQLIQQVQSQGFDLVIAGTHGQSAARRFWVGSTAGKLVRKCPSAVWITRADEGAAVGSVLVPCDFSMVSQKAVRVAAALALKAGAELHLLHVFSLDELPQLMPDTSEVDEEVGRYRRIVRRGAIERLRQCLAEAAIEPRRYTLHALPGIPWRSIGSAARRLKADLIVMGAVGRGGLAGLLIGNTAEKVLHTSSQSLLTVKPDGFVSPVPPVA
ncbi:MAG TPA: universal stress protein [Pirellulales bacterium]